ncbi:Rid family hydrolase [Bradyrhizobium sp. OK095]|uniref:Rid family hydrolase n=1 Tax=Bradyrhizobium sp. OK095 TaxID=1882760 RepID=UPI0008C940F6|nr:Rid family hydrolase [Bradyrhizobium sp. OK095]SEO24081.1 Enamine deaminase RidA, house cleaning of reactive enamine intermediates, YjgF/YER057c/UK114 family [Bradyrhizobium sp. OK095]
MPRQNVSSGYDFEDRYGYSRAVRVGNQVFVSGTTARTLQLGGDAYTQAKAALVIIADALAKTGAGMHHVVRTVVYVLDLADTEHVARAHSEAFDQIRPASTLVQVSALTPASARVEIEAMAIIHD